MKENLHDYRKVYGKHQLLEETVERNPFKLFRGWLKEAEAERELEEVNTMSVSTIGLDGFPKTRIVLLKEYDDEGFVFYTNYLSEKGRAITANPHVCLSFFWPKSERQVIIKGMAQKTSEEVSTVYFDSRPRGSQLGAWASEQSAVVPTREYLEARIAALEEEFKDKPVPKPPHWGGFKIFPEEFEFWQGRPNRLHDRLHFRKATESHWNLERLAP